MNTRLILIWIAVLSFACCLPMVAAPWLSDTFDSYTTGNLAGQGAWTGAAGTNYAYLKIFDPSGTEITRFYFADHQFKVLLGPANQTVVLDNVTNRTWSHIRLGIGLPSGRMDVWVDRVKKVDGGQTYHTASSIGRITIGQWNQAGLFTTSDAFIDNLLCTPSTTLALSPRFFPTWQNENVCYPDVIYDDATGKYIMYYAGSGSSQENDSAWDQWTTGIVTSTDLTNWAFPENYEAVLQAHKFMEGDVVDPDEESKIFDSICAYGACAVKDGTTFEMWYTGWSGDSEHLGGGITRKIDFRIGYATSPDGVTWTKHPGTAGAGSVLGLGPTGADTKGAAHPHVLKEDGIYRMWYEGFDGTVWRIMYATSTDGITWTRVPGEITLQADAPPVGDDLPR